ncbi:MAG: hypothetical protein L0H20_13820 [Corynebacterium sp.]|uniref:hypothetical protein n=1 Tax=Corynebacterium sp. TaxID=1720 RepID=UPI0026475DEC|nr:hypothetical protein [Corynebacterium sp.]MDN5724048.1 hypothetical protein [Corynebacterium sp.]
MNAPEPLQAATIDALTRAAVADAQAGEHRARRVSIGPRGGIVTPRTDDHGDLDADDLAAQIWALATDTPADDGIYTEGVFTSNGETHMIPYIPPEAD